MVGTIIEEYRIVGAIETPGGTVVLAERELPPRFSIATLIDGRLRYPRSFVGPRARQEALDMFAAIVRRQ